MTDTKTKVLDCAEHLARARGYDAFSYADIADEIGIKKASIHYHYPKKSDLALALITRYRADLGALLHALNQRDISAATKLKAYIAIYKEALSGGNSICLCIAFSAAKENLTKDVIQQLYLFRQDSIAWLSSIFAKGIKDESIAAVNDIEAEAYACLAMVEGAHLIARNDMTQFDNATALLLSRLR